jgi:dTDP-4-dehydrorhamnose 3,5-epimerase-like enzyme
MMLIFTSTYLYRENRSYQQENHRLIVSNDSILSVNIELKNQLQQKERAAMRSFDDNVKTKNSK